MNVHEIERKRELPGEAATVVQARLVEFGYRQDGTATEVDTYYSRPDRDFLATVECLRVRQREHRAELTYKPASTASTHSVEHIIAKRETTLVLVGADQAATANDLLVILGMVPLCRVEKTRRTWRHPDREDITVALDTITDLGSFVETEIIDADNAAAVLNAVEQQLGLEELPVVSVPYRDLVLRALEQEQPEAGERHGRAGSALHSQPDW